MIWQSDDMKAKGNWGAAQLEWGLLQVKNTPLVVGIWKRIIIYSGEVKKKKDERWV